MDRSAAPDDVLGPATLSALDAVGPVEVVLGVHCAGRTGAVIPALEAACTALAKHESGRRTVVVVAGVDSDGAFTSALRAWAGSGEPWPARRPLELGGRRLAGSAFLGVLQAVRRLDAQSCALIDGDGGTPAPEAMEALLEPLRREEADFVSPAYSRSTSEGTLTTNLLAPLTRALYGKRLQQLTGGCAGLSGRLVEACLERGTPEPRWTTPGLEIWVTTEALASGVRVAEVPLGRRPARPAGPGPDLATTLAQTVGPLFGLMERHDTLWPDVRGSEPVPLKGESPGLVPETQATPTDRMVRALQLGLKDLLPVWEQIMPETTLGQLYPLGLLAADEFRLPHALWARIVSDFAVAHHERRLPREHLVRALTPLYLGRVAAFLREAQGRGPAALLELLDSIGRTFEAEKPSLVSRWR